MHSSRNGYSKFKKKMRRTEVIYNTIIYMAPFTRKRLYRVLNLHKTIFTFYVNYSYKLKYHSVFYVHQCLHVLKKTLPRYYNLEKILQCTYFAFKM